MVLTNVSRFESLATEFLNVSDFHVRSLNYYPQAILDIVSSEFFVVAPAILINVLISAGRATAALARKTTTPTIT